MSFRASSCHGVLRTAGHNSSSILQVCPFCRHFHSRERHIASCPTAHQPLRFPRLRQSLLPSTLPRLTLHSFPYPTCPSHLFPPYVPSTSRLLANKNSPNHLNGLSGSFLATHFMPSSRLGVTFVLIYARVGLPAALLADSISALGMGWSADLEREAEGAGVEPRVGACLLYTSPSPRD